MISYKLNLYAFQGEKIMKEITDLQRKVRNWRFYYLSLHILIDDDDTFHALVSRYSCMT